MISQLNLNVNDSLRIQVEDDGHIRITYIDKAGQEHWVASANTNNIAEDKSMQHFWTPQSLAEHVVQQLQSYGVLNVS